MKFIKDILSGEDSLDRACKDIPESSCRHSAGNYRKNLWNGAMSKLAEQVAGPNLVIPWLLTLAGAPVWMIGFAMPLKQTFSLLPQMAVAGYIRKIPVRKKIWVMCGIFQAVCLSLMIPAVLFLPAATAGFAVLFLLTFFSMASGTASIAFQDVLGKTIDKGVRGKLLSARALIGGVLTIFAGFLINRSFVQDNENAIFYLIAFGGILWFLSAMFFSAIREEAGAVEGARNPIDELGKGLSFFREYKGFRRFLIARTFLLVTEIAVPFYTFYAGVKLGSATGLLGMFITAIGVSQMISSPFWGKMADETSRKVMAYSGIISALAAVVALMTRFTDNSLLITGLILTSFVLVGLGEAGVRLGRKTYLVDAAPKDERATFTAFSNGVIGIAALCSGLLGVFADSFGADAVIMLIGVISLLASAAAFSMPEADDMTKQ